MQINVTLEILDDETEFNARENIVRFQRLIQEALDRGFPVKRDHMANVLITRFARVDVSGTVVVETIRRVRYVVALVAATGQIKGKHSTHDTRDGAEGALVDAAMACTYRSDGCEPRVMTEHEFNSTLGARYALTGL
jgi:hypothetical protein